MRSRLADGALVAHLANPRDGLSRTPVLWSYGEAANAPPWPGKGAKWPGRRRDPNRRRAVADDVDDAGDTAQGPGVAQVSDSGRDHGTIGVAIVTASLIHEEQLFRRDAAIAENIEEVGTDGLYEVVESTPPSSGQAAVNLCPAISVRCTLGFRSGNSC